MFKLRDLLLGKPRNPMRRNTRKHIALIAFLAWIGLGADGLSSSAYGPEQAFYALGTHTHLALFLALITAFTVFLISLAYNQVIRLFPNGGGGYKVASKLIGPYAGLVSGAALIIDYILTIAISIAAGTDAIFSLLPFSYQPYKLLVESVMLIFLLVLNLRGAKESIKLLMIIFLGFFISHLFMIFAGIIMHAPQLPGVISTSVIKTKEHIQLLGWGFMLALFIRAYSLGAGTYTGIEAVSNNVHILAEPRVRTGSWTMLYMAISLSFVAGGIIFLYLLWHVTAVPGQTLNAVVFKAILSGWPYQHTALLTLLLFEAGLLFVASNTGFLGGPAVLANMSLDSWVPRRFSMLSSRLVTQNGIIFFGLSALVILLATNGEVDFLVVLYSMNVFLTFSMSLWGLSTYWWQHRAKEKRWIFHLFFSLLALLVCLIILSIMLISKFEMGGWITVVITGTTVACCLIIKKHYRRFHQLKKKLDLELYIPITVAQKPASAINPIQPTAVFLVKEIGAAMHSLLWVNRIFPQHFHNFVFISFGEVDIGSFGSEESLRKLEEQTAGILNYLVKYSQAHGVAAESYSDFGTDAIAGITKMAEKINKKYTNTIYFSSRYVYPSENWFTRLLHSDAAGIIQRRLHALGAKMLILPLKLQA
ncbi:MAG: amino acid transporter [Coxiella sp. RIFCSPHIGHO2_12_FULL_44_14]|nr:MAG: amino acid transporter [Coxiella sp. RIFCSPHIGHO2_12_FULL_44_14]